MQPLSRFGVVQKYIIISLGLFTLMLSQLLIRLFILNILATYLTAGIASHAHLALPRVASRETTV
jgi:hypothetical protein